MDRYEGNWVKGNRDGKGKLTTTNGESYEGDWSNNIKHGIGK